MSLERFVLLRGAVPDIIGGLHWAASRFGFGIGQSILSSVRLLVAVRVSQK